jgi:hypothetical protein
VPAAPGVGADAATQRASRPWTVVGALDANQKHGWPITHGEHVIGVASRRDACECASVNGRHAGARKCHTLTGQHPCRAGILVNAGRVEYVCVDGDHVIRGRDRPDGSGHLTLVRQKWAYCSAGLPAEPHDWRGIDAVELTALKHDRLPSVGGGG